MGSHLYALITKEIDKRRLLAYLMKQIMSNQAPHVNRQTHVKNGMQRHLFKMNLGESHDFLPQWNVTPVSALPC